MTDQLHRRRFLKTALAGSSLVALGGPTIPLFLGRSAQAADRRPDAAVLVVIQLLGGNDGLNTVVPFDHDGYRRNRRLLRLPSGQIHKVTDTIGLHPGLGGMADLLEEGRLAIVQGVGYPNPNRSHFESMEIWESAFRNLDSPMAETGWLGRSLDRWGARGRLGDDVAALHVGGGDLPLALRSGSVDVPSLQSLEQYRLRIAGDSERRGQTLDQLDRSIRQATLNSSASGSSQEALLGFIGRSTLTAFDSSRRLEDLDDQEDADVEYPSSGLARRLQLIARIIKAGFGTRIYYTTLGGFDTHANQLGTHAQLLGELGDALSAFQKDLQQAGQGDRVTTLTFSEFGRRVRENASNGTDHGAAAPVFVIGPVQQTGLIGDHPSIDDLDDGDLKHHTDFRRIYASLLRDWLEIDPVPIIGSGFDTLPLFPSRT